MQTHFSSHTIAEIFRDLFHGERSGVLSLSRGDEQKRVYVDRGMILFAESDAPDDDLGQRLVSEGKISPGALAEARKSIAESKDLAQALINRDLIGKESLAHTVRFVSDRVIASVFRWEGGTARFADGWLVQEIFDADVVTTVQAILRGVEEMVGFDAIREALLAVDAPLRRREHSVVPLDQFALSSTKGFVLSRIDGRTSFRDAISTLPPGDAEEEATRFLYGLLVLGELTFDPPLADGPFQAGNVLREHTDRVALEEAQKKTIHEAYRQARRDSPFEVLGVPTDTTREEVEWAYEEAKSALRRDRFAPQIQEEMKSELAYVETRFVEAYLALMQQAQAGSAGYAASSRQRRDVPPAEGVAERPAVGVDDLLVRVEMDMTTTKKAIEANRRVAATYFQKARRAMREADLHTAIQYCKLAISYSPEEARFYATLAECQARNPESRWQRWAEQNLVRATELDPWNPDHWISLGKFYKGRGLSLRARKMLDKALEIAPNHDAAVAELRDLA